MSSLLHLLSICCCSYESFLSLDNQMWFYTLPCRLVGWSVGWLVGPSVHPSVTFLNSKLFLHDCSCPIAVTDLLCIRLCINRCLKKSVSVMRAARNVRFFKVARSFFLELNSTRPTPISRVRDLQIDLEWLRMTQYTLKWLKEIKLIKKVKVRQTDRPTDQPTEGRTKRGVESRTRD